MSVLWKFHYIPQNGKDCFYEIIDAPCYFSSSRLRAGAAISGAFGHYEFQDFQASVVHSSTLSGQTFVLVCEKKEFFTFAVTTFLRTQQFESSGCPQVYGGRMWM